MIVECKERKSSTRGHNHMVSVLLGCYSSMVNSLGTTKMQKLKWECEKCGWEYRIDYHPSPENMDKMLSSVRPRHTEESPDCDADGRYIMCRHL